MPSGFWSTVGLTTSQVVASALHCEAHWEEALFRPQRVGQTVWPLSSESLQSGRRILADVDVMNVPQERYVVNAVSPYPLTFKPLYMQRVWGGRTLSTRFGRTLPEGQIGESWDLVDRPDAVSEVLNGPLQGWTLHALWQELPHWFGAPAVEPPTFPRPERFPLLIKLLDCRERLSVQVHPDEAAAALLGGEAKSELWVFLETSPEAEIFAGLKAGVTPERLRQALTKGGAEVVPLLNRLEPTPGDVLFVPAGCLHAIGAGVLLAEVQQNSDTTFRVYDWDRTSQNGQPRPLHTEASLACVKTVAQEAQFSRADAHILHPGPYFSVEHCSLEAVSLEPQTLPTVAPVSASDTFWVGMLVQGQLELETAHETLRVEEGQTFLIPAQLSCRFIPRSPQVQYLKVQWVPGTASDTTP